MDGDIAKIYYMRTREVSGKYLLVGQLTRGWGDCTELDARGVSVLAVGSDGLSSISPCSTGPVLRVLHPQRLGSRVRPLGPDE